MSTLYELLQQAGVRAPAPESTQITVNKNPFKHQVTGINAALSSANLRFGLYDDPGCGKTLISQAVILHYQLLGNNILIVMPPTLIAQFKESFDENFSGWQQFARVHTLDDGPNERAVLTQRWKAHGIPNVLLMSYTMFSKVYYRSSDQRLLKELTSQHILLSRGRPPGVEEEEYRKKLKSIGRKKQLIEIDRKLYLALSASGQDVVVCDESHYMRKDNKAFKALRSYIREEGKKALLSMTGTVVYNTLSDVCNMVRLTSPDIYQTKDAFQQLHEIRNPDSAWGEMVVAYANVDTMTSNVYRHGRRVLKEDVFSLEKPIVQEVPVKLAPAHKALYKKLVRERVLSVGTELIDATSQQALRQACLRIVSTPEMFSDKKIPNEMVNSVDELLDDIGMAGGKEKVVLFCTFHSTADMLKKHYVQYNPVMMNGQVSPAGKELSRKAFLTDDKCRMMIANPESGGVGLNLQSVCRYEIFLEPDAIPGRFKQAAQRVHRPGQTKVVTIYIMRAIGTLFPKIISVMLGRERDTLNVLKDKTSILEELLPGE